MFPSESRSCSVGWDLLFPSTSDLKKGGMPPTLGEEGAANSNEGSSVMAFGWRGSTNEGSTGGTSRESKSTRTGLFF
jgi:hypothetical protein